MLRRIITAISPLGARAVDPVATAKWIGVRVMGPKPNKLPNGRVAIGARFAMMVRPSDPAAGVDQKYAELQLTGYAQHKGMSLAVCKVVKDGGQRRGYGIGLPHAPIGDTVIVD